MGACRGKICESINLDLHWEISEYGVYWKSFVPIYSSYDIDGEGRISFPMDLVDFIPCHIRLLCYVFAPYMKVDIQLYMSTENYGIVVLLNFHERSIWMDPR